jgi:hypothetical protein
MYAQRIVTSVLKAPADSIFRVGRHFYPEDGGSIFLLHAGTHLPGYMVEKPRRSQLIIFRDPYTCNYRIKMVNVSLTIHNVFWPIVFMSSIF